MHLEIDKLYFVGDRLGMDFEYDEEFRKYVARVCGTRYMSKKDLQFFIIEALTNVISSEQISELKDCIDD
jgi:hypothetical protein